VKTSQLNWTVVWIVNKTQKYNWVAALILNSTYRCQPALINCIIRTKLTALLLWHRWQTLIYSLNYPQAQNCMADFTYKSYPTHIYAEWEQQIIIFNLMTVRENDLLFIRICHPAKTLSCRHLRFKSKSTKKTKN